MVVTMKMIYSINTALRHKIEEKAHKVHHLLNILQELTEEMMVAKKEEVERAASMVVEEEWVVDMVVKKEGVVWEEVWEEAKEVAEEEAKEVV